MRNLILEKIARLMLYFIVVIAVFFLMRGHQQPGGGFIAGIVASTGFILYAIVFGTNSVQKILYFDTRYWMGTGLLVAVLSGIVSVFMGLPPLTAIWWTPQLPLLGELPLGTPLLFDFGVFLVVIGVVLSIVFSVMEVLEWNL